MKIDICGTWIDAVTMGEAVDALEGAIRKRRAGQQDRPLAVFTANVDMLVKVARDPEFARDFAQADLLLADGMPLLWMARGLGRPIPERVTGSDLVPLLAARSALHGYSLFLLGGMPGVADRAAEKLARDCPGLRLAGTLSPPLGFERDPEMCERIVEAVRDARPDVVVVSLGAPKQERWILSERTRVDAAVFLGAGGTLDLLAGVRKRAPRLFQRFGLEWLWRMIQEPARLGRRYLIDDMYIVPLYARALWSRYVESGGRRQPPTISR